MNQTNYLLFDFLEVDQLFTQEEFLWRAYQPTAIEEFNGEITLKIPFQRMLPQNDLAPDENCPQQIHELHISSYGEVLRVSIDFNQENIQSDSGILVPETFPMKNSLSIQKSATKWEILDENNQLRGVVNLVQPEIDHWSDLLPEPYETLDLTLFPNDGNAIKFSGYDQFFPARQDAFALAYITKSDAVNRATFSLEATYDEVFVGTGERFSKLDLSGKTFQLKNQDGQGVNNKRTYKNIPFYLSNRGYGVFVNTTAYSKFSLADHSSRSAQTLVENDKIDLFLIGGKNPAAIIRNYQLLTGVPQMPPLWSFGIWMSRMTYFSADEVHTICNRMRDEDYPCDVIHLDTGWFVTDWLCEWKFNPERFPDPKGFVQKLKKQGYRVSLWQMPYIAKEALQHDEAIAHEYIGPLKESREQGGSNFSALDYAGTIDFTYDKAVAWYKDLLRELLEMGVTCIKTDFGEEIHLDASYKGMDAKLLNNLYALLYQKAAFEVTEEVCGEGIVWARAGWAGCQRYPLHWGGDAACSWEGMAGSLKGGLHIGLSGFAFWSHDVPGFHSVPNFMNGIISDELYMRWTQFGVFSSHIRYHGTSKREPYEYPNISGVIRDWWKLRYALIPYILEASKQATESGFPVLRAMVFAYPNDKTCWHIDDQYFLGDDILVAPIMNDEGKRDVYLPEGEWVDFFTGVEVKGGTWLKDQKYDLRDMPVWVKKNAVLPVYPLAVSCTDEMDFDLVQKVKIDNAFKGFWDYVPVSKAAQNN